jgi:hypothetical protein
VNDPNDHYASFVVRWHRLVEVPSHEEPDRSEKEQDGERVEIEHIQSGARTRVGSMTHALEWMDRQFGRNTERPQERESRSR